MKENLPYIAAIIGFSTLLLAIVGSAGLNWRALERQMNAFRNEMRVGMKHLEDKLDLNLKAINDQLERISERLSVVEAQLREIFKNQLA